MKKILLIAVITVTAFFIYYSSNNKKEEIETRGVFISYIEIGNYFEKLNEEEAKEKVAEIINNIKKYNLNTIYLHTRFFSDSIYPSNIFPFTDIIENNINLLEMFIDESHKNNIKLYAWINPYRIFNTTNIDRIDKNSIAYSWLNTDKVKVIDNKGIYFNPASSEVIDLIVSGVKEIIDNYKVDGIILDDYFYPDKTIDLNNYEEVKNTISIDEYRMNNVNELVKNIYKTIKSKNKNILFGIAPDGNINNNYDTHYVDIKKWLSEDGYIDFIMPQLYYGFRHETKPYIKTINEWNNLIQNNVKLIPALALYKSGNIDTYAKSGKNEWIEDSNIIKKQIEVSRNISNYIGYSIYRYDYMLDNKNVNLIEEMNNYMEIFK